jgi:hypothetical protein
MVASFAAHGKVLGRQVFPVKNLVEVEDHDL